MKLQVHQMCLEDALQVHTILTLHLAHISRTLSKPHTGLDSFFAPSVDHHLSKPTSSSLTLLSHLLFYHISWNIEVTPTPSLEKNAQLRKILEFDP